MNILVLLAKSFQFLIKVLNGRVDLYASIKDIDRIQNKEKLLYLSTFFMFYSDINVSNSPILVPDANL